MWERYSGVAGLERLQGRSKGDRQGIVTGLLPHLNLPLSFSAQPVVRFWPIQAHPAF